MKRISALVVIFPVVISVYMIFECWNVAAYYNFSRDTIMATHITDIVLLDTSSATLQKGYFTSMLTLENPTSQTLDITKLVVEYYQTSGPLSTRVALGNLGEPIELNLGKTQIVLQMNLSTNAPLTQPSYWIVNYRLRFGSAHYSFTSRTNDSVLSTWGPYSVGEYQASTQVITYTLVGVDAWVIGLEVMAALILFQDRKIDKDQRLPGEKAHSKMLATTYGIQGIGVILVPLYLYLTNLVIPEPLSEFPYGFHGAAGIAVFFLMVLVFLISLIFLGTAVGLLLRHLVAKTAALFLSSISVLVWLFGGVITLTRWSSVQDLALATLYLGTTVANVIALYILLKR